MNAMDMYDKRKNKVCYYNEGVDCEKRQCAKCGWDPSVFERRKAETRERYRVAARLMKSLHKGVR